MLRFNDNKAGMAGLDKERIERIISENTGTKYKEHEKRKNERIQRRIAEYQSRIAQFTNEELTEADTEMSEYCERLLLEHDANQCRTIVHIDMDAFFAAVEMRDNPELRNVPMAVGDSAMLCTSNYIARRYGVRAAMPGFIAKKLCPNLRIVPGRRHAYQQISKVVGSIFREYDSNLEMRSLDEAVLELTEHLSHRTTPRTWKRLQYSGECVCRLPRLEHNAAGGDAEEPAAKRTNSMCEKCGKESVLIEDTVAFDVGAEDAVMEIRFRVEQDTGLTCSAGISVNWVLAKIGSDVNKPNGQYATNKDIYEFLFALPVRKFPGIGPVSTAILKGLGVETIEDIVKKRAIIRLLFSKSTWDFYMRAAVGLPGSCEDVEGGPEKAEDHHQKSLSAERTFTPTSSLDDLSRIAQDLAEELIHLLSSAGVLGGRCATLKVKFSDFESISRSVTVPYRIETVEQLTGILGKAVRKECKDREVRLLGVRLSKLEVADESVSPAKQRQRTLAPWLSSDVGPGKPTLIMHAN